MKKSFPSKLGFPALLLAIILAFTAMFVTIGYIDYKKLSTSFDSGVLIGLLFFMLILGYPIFYLSSFFRFYFKSASIENESISVYQLNRGRTVKVPISEIKGYSTSEVFLGKYGWKSKSIVLYLPSSKAVELMNAFVCGLDDLESELKNHGVPYLGAEPYQSAGTYTREYQFDKP